MCVCARVCARVRALVRACMCYNTNDTCWCNRVCMRACVRVCVCVRTQMIPAGVTTDEFMGITFRCSCLFDGSPPPPPKKTKKKTNKQNTHTQQQHTKKRENIVPFNPATPPPPPPPQGHSPKIQGQNVHLFIYLFIFCCPIICVDL